MSRPTYAPKQTYTGTGSLSAYTFNFKIEVLTQLLIVEVDDSDVETQRVLGDDVVYLSSVTFDPVDGAGTVNLAANLATNYRLIILLANDDPTQTYEFRNKTSFTLKRFESAMDFMTGAVQRLAYRGKQALRIHDLDDEDTFDGQFPPRVDLAGEKVLIINTAGNGVDFGPDVTTILDAIAAGAAAAISEANAAASEVAAAASAAAAATSETNAATSETNAAASAAAAASSAVGAWEVLAAEVISAAGSMTQGTDVNQLLTVTGNGGAITTSNTPLGATPPTDGYVFRIKGDHATNTVTIPHADVVNGFYLNGDITLSKFTQLTVQWDSTNQRYFEISRSN